MVAFRPDAFQKNVTRQLRASRELLAVARRLQEISAELDPEKARVLQDAARLLMKATDEIVDSASSTGREVANIVTSS